MLLAIDIGNSNVVIGLFEGVVLKRHWRIPTDRRKSADEYGIIIQGLLAGAGLQAGNIGAAVISSVAPPLDAVFKEAVSKLCGVSAAVACADMAVDMPVLTDNPAEVGSDRLVNAYAALHLHGAPLIAVDFGTATTFDCVTAAGEFAGGVIAPGLNISAEALFEKAAKLPRIEVKRPDKVIGGSTVESMLSGIYFGHIALADGIIERITVEMGAVVMPKVIATGGLSRLIAPELKRVDVIDEFLTLKGLRLIYEGTGDDD